MHTKQKLLIRITCFFWLIAKICAYKAWLTTGRTYPVVAPLDFLDVVPPIVHTILYGLTLCGLVLLLIFPQKRLLIAATFIVILCSCSLDVLRWQPWEYQFLFFLLIFIINHNNPKVLYSAIVFVMASVYIYSGLHKINGGFLHSVWESLMLKKFFGVSNATIVFYKLHYAGLALAVIEAALGVGLLVMKNKKLPASLLIVMHVFIIIMLGKTGLNHNKIILPWNAAMICFLYFYYCKEHYRFSFTVIANPKNAVILLFWGIMPALSFIGYWDAFLSSSLYSGNSKQLHICIKNTEAVQSLSPYFSKIDRRNLCNGQVKISMYEWTYTETSMLPYPADWYFKKFKAKFEKMYPGTEGQFVTIAYPYKERETLE